MRILRHQTYTIAITVLTVLLFCTLQGTAQDSTSLADKIINFPDKVFGKVENKAANLDKKLTQQTEKYLSKLERQEKKLYRKLLKKDSAAAKELFGDIQGRYNELKNKATTKVNKLKAQTNVYSSKLDSLGTAFNFIKQNKLLNTAALDDKLQKSMSSLTALQGKLNSTEQIQRILKQRRQQLKEQLEKFGMTKQLKQFKKSVYYYQQQAREYKEIVENPEKLQRKLMDWAMKQPAFKEFFAKNSMLASFFPMPGSGLNTAGQGAQTGFAGLQTRSQVLSLINGQPGMNAPNFASVLQKNIQSAQGVVDQLRNKLNSYGGGDDLDMPDFKPRNIKTKNFKQRLEIGTNLQTQKANFFFPTTTDFGFSAGYTLNDKGNIIGIGSSFKMGWGKNIQHIRISGEGLSLRSFLELKLKNSFYAAGGLEYNYQQSFSEIRSLYNQDVWKKSALLGISKTISMKSKFFKKTKLQLLYDFLYREQLPVTEPLKFRVGYSF
jgi:hypothetical protein